MALASGRACRLDVSRLTSALESARVEVLILTSPASIRWATGYSLWLDPQLKSWMLGGQGEDRALPAAALVSVTGAVVLVAPTATAPDALEADATSLVLHGDLATERQVAAPSGVDRFSTFGAAVARGLSLLAMDDPVLAIENLDSARALGILSDCRDLEVVDGTLIARALRAVKTDAEVAALADCATLTEKALHAALGAASAGTDMRVLLQIFREVVAEGGADFDHMIWSGRTPGVATRGHRLQTDDALQVDVGCILDGVFSDTGITLLGEEAPASFQAAFETARASLDAGAAALRPGIEARTVVAAMHEVLAEAGLTGRLAHGHGIGYELRDLPILMTSESTPEASMVIATNMVINLEVPIVYPDEGTVFVEATYVVRDDGAAPICRQDRSRASKFS